MRHVKSIDEVASTRNGSGVLQRLKWLDDRLCWVGTFRRSDYSAKHGISDAQASADIAIYVGNSSTPPLLDRRLGKYVAPAEFRPLFDADDKQLTSWLSDHQVSFEDVSAVPEATPYPLVMRSILSAIETSTPVQIIYQSMTSDDSSERIICPHALVRASRRLYVRAWDDKRRRFADFVVLRIKASAIVEGAPWIPAELDDEWNQMVEIVLVPNPELSSPQASTVAVEYKMEKGRLVIRTRAALVIYLIVELGLIDVVRTGRATKGKLVVPENSAYLRELIFGKDHTA
jgi:hypothetical protein